MGRAGFGGSCERRGLSYVVRRSFRGQGLATEVAHALVGWHLSHTADVPLRGVVAVGNDASVRVLEKVGLHEVGQEDFEGTTVASSNIRLRLSQRGDTHSSAATRGATDLLLNAANARQPIVD